MSTTACTSSANIRDVVIIGSGPAGLTAAIYAARASLEPLLLEGELSSTSDQPGGQLMLTTEVENFPGFREGVMGPDLMAEMRAQAERFGTELVAEKAVDVEFSGRPFSVTSSSGAVYLARSVIISTGAQALMLGLDEEKRLLGHGLSTCATCDGFFFRGQEIAVVGGGDSALEEALFLSKFASKVNVIVRRNELRASKVMQERAFSNAKIAFTWESSVQRILGADAVEAVELLNNRTGNNSVLPVTGVFVAIGHKPNTDLFRGALELDAAGYVVTTKGSSATSVPGVFACGDVQDDTYRQAITAAGSGCMAAIDAERWLG